ncbi:MAG: acyl-CoA desaturase [SAR324 cluster bacterium]|nr:acyl-CoA desaturase [SAR324 cluster bacterium]
MNRNDGIRDDRALRGRDRPTVGNGPDAARRVRFSGGNDFQAALQRRVDEFLGHTGIRTRDCPQMYVKTGVILLSFAVLYALLVFVASAWYTALPLAVMLGLVTAEIGFNIMHDGGHGAYSARPWINRLMVMSLDMIGASSYLWRWKHGIFHHTYPNVTGQDPDIELGVLGRLAPQQPRRMHHRWQQWYIWPLYGVLGLKWHAFDDFHDVLIGHIAGRRFPRPRGRDLAVFVGGKILFFGLVFGLPLLLHPLWVVAVLYGVWVFVLGMALSVVFQLAHCVEEAEFPLPNAETLRLERPWAVHQVETAVDFLRTSRVACWLLGGLNFQIEHHLFPRICHVHYPALAKLVEDTSREFGVRYHVHRSIWAALASHFRWLRAMGAPA